MAASDAKPVPRYGEAFRVYFALRYVDGRLDTGWINPSGFISKDGAAFNNVTTQPSEIPGSRGCGYCDLTGTEMSADGVTLILQDTKAIMGAIPNSGMPLVLTFYPEQIGDYRLHPGAIGSGVWDETIGVHATFGSAGRALTAASGNVFAGVLATPTNITAGTITNLTNLASGAIADSVWNQQVARNVYTGTFGKALSESSGNTIAAVIGTSVWTTPATRTITGGTVANLTNLASGAIADSVWNQQVARNVYTGTFGKALSEASGNTIAAVIGTSVWTTPSTRTITGGTVANLTNFPSGAVADAVWDETLSQHQTIGTTGYALNAASGNLIGSAGGATAAEVWSYATRTLTSFPSGAFADAVWDESLLDHLVSDTTGDWLYISATRNVDPWDEDLTSYGAGTAAYQIYQTITKTSGVVLDGIIDANILQASGNSVHIADFNRPVAGSISNITLADDTITTAKIATNAITASRIAADAITSSQLATSAVDEIVDQVWNEVLSGHLTAGSTGDALNQASGTVLRQGPTGAGLTAIPTVATVTNLTNFPSGAVADSVWNQQVARNVYTGTFGKALSDASGNTITAIIGNSVWTVPATRQLTGTQTFNLTGNIAGTITRVDNLTNLASGAIADAVWDEVLSGHQTIGTTGYALNAASGNLIGSSAGPTAAQIADAVWDEVISDHQTIGTTGYALNTASGNLIGSTSGPTTADIWSYSNRTLTSFPSGAFADAVWDEIVTGHTATASAGKVITDTSTVTNTIQGNIGTNGNALTAIPTIANVTTVTNTNNLINFPSGAVADAVWDEQISTHNAFGTAGRALTAASGNVYNALTSGDIITAVWFHKLDEFYEDPMAGYTIQNGLYTAIDSVNTNIGVNGVNLTAIPTIANVSNLINFPSGAVADAVWDEQIATHSVFGTAGRALTAASGNVFAGVLATPTNITAGTITNLTNLASGAIADAVWDEIINTHGAFGSAGRALTAASGNDFIGVHASPTNITGGTLTTVTNLTNFPSGAVADAVWDELISQHQVIGTTGYALNAASGNFIGSVGAAPSTADIWSYATRTLTAPVSVSGIPNVNVIQVSGEYVSATQGVVDANIVQIKGADFELGGPVSVSGIVQADVIRVNGIDVDTEGIIDANVVQVSGVDVSLIDFATAVSMSGGATAAEVWAYTTRTLTSLPSGAIAEAVWNEQVTGNIYAGTFGDALNTASGIALRQGATGAGLSAIPTISNVTTVANLTNFPSGAVADAVWDEIINTHGTFGSAGRALTAASGNDFIGVHASPTNITAGTLTTVGNLTNFPSGAVADAVWDEQIATHGVFGTAGRALTAASGNDFIGVHASPTNITAGTITNLTNFPSGAIADAVWDEPNADHLVSGTFGYQIFSIPTTTHIWTHSDRQLTSFPSGAFADAIWDETLSQHQTIGTTGYALNASSGNFVGIVNANIVKVSGEWVGISNAVPANVVQVSGQLVHISDFNRPVTGSISSTTFASNAITSSVIAADAIGSSQLATTAVDEIVDQVWNEAMSGHNTAGSMGDALNVASGNFMIGSHASPTNITGGTITTVVTTTNLTNLASGAIADAVWDEVLSQHQVFGTTGYALNAASGNLIGVPTGLTAADVWGYTTRQLTSFPSGAFADAVWDEQIAEHSAFGTAGRALTAASGNVFAGVLATPTNITAGTITNLTNFPSGAVADAVWDEILSGHQVIGTTGYALNTASGNLIGGTTLTAAQVWSYTDRLLTSFPSGAFADAIWDEPINQHRTETSAGYALIVASGNLIGAGTSGSFTPADVWSFGNRTLTGIVDANIVQISGQSAGLAGYVPANVVQVSGIDVSWTNEVNANIIEVSGVPVSLADFGGTGGVASVSGVVSANIVSISGIPVNIDSSSVADSEELNTLGDLLLRRARIIRLVP